MIRKICIITPGTIASNPRVVKEAAALSAAGYKVHLIYTRHVNYLVRQDDDILASHPEWSTDYLDCAGPALKSKVNKVLSGVKRKLSNVILKIGLYPNSSASFLLNRFYYWQLRKAINCKADVYIAHYPDSIAIAANAAKANETLFAFDAEDYHRGEDIPPQTLKAIKLIENHFLGKAQYITASSPMIADFYRKLFPGTEVLVLENVFPLSRQIPFNELKINPYKFFWFSQTIGIQRGIEEFIITLGLVEKKDIQLTLLGNCTSEYRQKLELLWAKNGLNPQLLLILPPTPEKEIFRIASEHHFGLALEIPYSLNRDICLTNKLFTYILSGNRIILSDTRAQKAFYFRFPEIGICIDLKKPKETAAKILGMLNDPDINIKRRSIYELGEQYLNFDIQKQVLLQQINKTWK